MGGENYYLVTALPTLGKLGGEVPITLQQLLEHVGPAADACQAIETILLGGDLIQREAVQSGELKSADPIVLTEAQLRDEQPLPEYLAENAELQSRRRIAADAVWEAYFRYAAGKAEIIGNGFLSEWVASEVALRNALAERRAKNLELDANDYLVAADLASDEDYTLLVNEWASAANPLAGLRILDRCRWDWVSRHDRWFTFANDELAAYAAKLMLLDRWQRLEASKTEPAEPFVPQSA